jgi:hypothetical protein
MMAVMIIAYYYIQKTEIHEKQNLYNNTTTQDNDLVMTMAQDLKVWTVIIAWFIKSSIYDMY